MSSFEPNKRHLREHLIYFFNLKKSTTEGHRLLVEILGEAAINERSCREWFQKFKNGKFDIEDKERSARTKVFRYSTINVQFLIKIGRNLFVHLIQYRFQFPGNSLSCSCLDALLITRFFRILQSL